jgi:hypothetical protein
VRLPPDTSRVRVADLEALHPTFRRKVEALLARMRADGFDPMVWETYRTPARAKLLSARGTGAKPRADGSIPIGMHQLGLAVDIVSSSKRWSPKPTFWVALGKHAKALGLTWGGAWRNPKTGKLGWDKPHVQAVPVRDQEALRAEFRAKGVVTYVA